MTDKELITLAAKAAGVGYADKEGKFVPFVPETWNPLTDDGDALRLAVKLRLVVDIDDEGGEAFVRKPWCSECEITEAFLDDPYAATRRAIVRAAAQIGGTL